MKDEGGRLLEESGVKSWNGSIARDIDESPSSSSPGIPRWNCSGR